MRTSNHLERGEHLIVLCPMVYHTVYRDVYPVVYHIWFTRFIAVYFSPKSRLREGTGGRLTLDVHFLAQTMAKNSNNIDKSVKWIMSTVHSSMHHSDSLPGIAHPFIYTIHKLYHSPSHSYHQRPNHAGSLLTRLPHVYPTLQIKLPS